MSAPRVRRYSLGRASFRISVKRVAAPPLTPNQKKSNKAKSRKRVRVEHVFAFMTGSMNAMFKRHVGYVRNRASVVLANLGYKMARTEQIIQLKILGRKTPQLA